MTHSTHSSRRLAALLMVAPVILAACGITWWQIDLTLTASDPYAGWSFVDALREDYFEVAFEYIRSGQDPNAPVAFQDDRLTGGEELMLTPILIAVAHGRADTVAMLMSSGVDLDAPGNRFAVCLARRLGHDDIAEAIVRNGGAEAAEATCPEMEVPEEAPLRAYVE